MRVAFVTDEYHPHGRGGAAVSARLLTEALQARDHDVDVYMPWADGTPPPGPDVRTFPWSGRRRLWDLNRAAFECLRGELEAYDVVHVYNVVHLPGVRAATRQPAVVATLNSHVWSCPDPVRCEQTGTDHGTLPGLFDLAVRGERWGTLQGIGRLCLELAGRKIARRATRFLALSHAMMEDFINAGYPASRFEVVPNILDPRFLASQPPEGSDLVESGRFVILFAGRLAPEKGPQDVLEAYAQLDQEVRDRVELKLLGEGPLRTRLQRRAHDIRGNVSIGLRPYHELPQIYAGSDLFVSPSLWNEPFSRTWLEAMATGTPILAAANKGAQEILAGVAAFYPPGDVVELASNLEEFIRAPDRGESLAARGTERLRHCQPEAVSSDYERAYERAVEAR